MEGFNEQVVKRKNKSKQLMIKLLALVLLFGNTEYLQGLIGGKNILVFICTFVGINAVVEMIATTAAVGTIGKVLNRFVQSGR